MSRPKTVAATYKSLMLRLPTAMLEACKERAAAERRSLNAQLLWVIDEWLQRGRDNTPHVTPPASE